MKSDKQASFPAAALPARAISATHAARTFSDLLNRVQYRGERFIIERSGEPVGELCPVTHPSFTGRDLIHLLETLPSPDAAFEADVMAGVRHQPAMSPSHWDTGSEEKS